MSKAEFGIYKYKVPSEYMISGSNTFENFIKISLYIIITFSIFKFWLINIEFASIFIILSIIIGITMLKGIGKSNYKIFVGNRYIIIGEKIIYYSNLAEIQISNNGSRNYEMISKTNKRYKIELDRFPTNARKSWKIEKNKKEKFEKITTKISNNIQKLSPNISIKKVL